MRKLLFVAVAAICGAAVADEANTEPIENNAEPAVSEEEYEEVLVEESARSTWHFRIGAVMSPRVRSRMHGPKLNYPELPEAGYWRQYGSYDADGNWTDTPANIPSRRSSTDPTFRREYADGFVDYDNNSGIDGMTWNFGTTDDIAGHYNQYAETLTFHTPVFMRDKSVYNDVSQTGANSSHDRDILLGIEAMGGFTFYEDGDFFVDWDFGFRMYGSDDQTAVEKYGATTITTLRDFRYADVYNAEGWMQENEDTGVIEYVGPTGKHTGTKEGPGALIDSDPLYRRLETSGYQRYTDSYWSYSRTKLEYRIWDLRMGPTFGWQPCDYVTFRWGVYGLLGLVDAKLTSDVQNTDGVSAARKSKCDPVFGLAAGGSVQVNLTDNLFVMAGIEYDWWTDTVELWAGEADASIELSDFSASFAVGVEF